MLLELQEEAVPESLKNILLVMAAGDVLVRPEIDPREEKKELWIQTWRRLERFLPDLKAELFPPLPAPPVTEEAPMLAPGVPAVTPVVTELPAPVEPVEEAKEVVAEKVEEEKVEEKSGAVDEPPVEVKKAEVESEID